MIGMLKGNGLISQALAAVGLVRPGSAIHTDLAVYIGIVYNYLPFMILPLTATLMRLDFKLLEAAADLGARARGGVPAGDPAAVDAGHHRRRPAGVHPAVGEFVIPDILGGPTR